MTNDLQSVLDDCANGDGTYNGIKLLQHLTGRPGPELQWAAERTRELIWAGLPREQVVAQIKEEAKGEPWKPRT